MLSIMGLLSNLNSNFPVFKNELYPIHFYGRVRGKCDGRLQNWPGIANERPKFLAMSVPDTPIERHAATGDHGDQ